MLLFESESGSSQPPIGSLCRLTVLRNIYINNLEDNVYAEEDSLFIPLAHVDIKNNEGRSNFERNWSLCFFPQTNLCGNIWLGNHADDANAKTYEVLVGHE